jgi:hypothetical protein
LASNVFIINNNEKNISIKCNEIYFSDNIDIDLLGNNIIKLYNIKEPQKTIEFIMKITINLVAKDLDIYCKVIEFFPKFVIYNLLKEDVIIKCYNKEISVVNNVENNKEFLFLKSGDKNNFDFFGKSEKCRFTLTICNDDEIYNENNKNNNNNNNLKQSNISQKLNSTNKKEINYVYKNKYRKFTQDDIDHVCELCNFIADIIIKEKKTSVNNYFRKIDKSKQGFVTINQLKKIFKDDLEIEVDNDDSMNDFFDIILFDEKIGGNFIAKIDRIIEIIKTYSGKN